MTGGRIVAALGAACLLSACSSSSSLSAAALEQQVRSGLASTNPDFVLGTATCPAALPFSSGATEVCTVAVDGLAVDFTVRVTSTTSGQGNLSLTPVRPILDLGRAEQAVVAALAKSARTGTADCRTGNGGKAVLLADVGSTFRCTWVAGTASGVSTVQVIDATGAITATIDR